jgi:CheY-like chemotaxis protein
VRDYRDVPLAAASGPRLGQVALNLVLNAIESMPPRQDPPGELRVRTLVDDSGRVAFEVEDTGAGIAPATIGRIFDPFFTTKPVGSGTGLGLAICHQIVAGFGGEITVRSTLGRGSAFRVALPAAGVVSGVGAPEREPASERVCRRVLVIDDEPHLVGMIERMLPRPDYEIVSAYNAFESLERLGHDRAYDVVLCDLMMPGMSGMEFYDELRRSVPQLAPRVVFMTGGAFTAAAREFLARVTNRCLEKPFTIAQLEAELLLAAAPCDAAE